MKVRTLFLIDALGALISALMLGIVLLQYQAIFGIPVPILRFLAAVPCFFILYDLGSYLTNKSQNQLLKGIALANISYCILSLSLVSYHHEQLTWLGWGYIIGELMIILILVRIEWRTAHKST